MNVNFVTGEIHSSYTLTNCLWKQYMTFILKKKVSSVETIMQEVREAKKKANYHHL